MVQLLVAKIGRISIEKIFISRCKYCPSSFLLKIRRCSQNMRITDNHQFGSDVQNQQKNRTCEQKLLLRGQILMMEEQLNVPPRIEQVNQLLFWGLYYKILWICNYKTSKNFCYMFSASELSKSI